MCNFFSLVSNGKGKIYYFDWKLRKQYLEKKIDYHPDRHTSIADYYGFKGKDEDKLNKYEYNPITKEFRVDQINTTDDSKTVEKKCRALDFKKIIPQLIIKSIINPLIDLPERKKVTKKDIELLNQWASVRDYVRDSVWDYVGTSVRAYVGASVWTYVRDSVWDYVRTSVGTSVGASVGAYIGSFYNLPKWKYIEHKEGKYPFQPCVDLWERGLVPSFDGKTWRLHTGKKAKIVYEIEIEK